MKRSEMDKFLELAPRSRNEILLRMDAAGTPWSPEEEPLPESVTPSVIAAGFIGFGTQRRRLELSAIAAYRWNAWPKLRALVDRCFAQGAPARQAFHTILNGEEDS